MKTREYTPWDIPALSALWTAVFGDGEAVTSSFFKNLPNMGSCVVGEEDGKIVAMASVLCGQELQLKDKTLCPECGYIYAVAVDEAYRGRGYGKQITLAARDLAKKREAAIISVMPASDSLFDFYRSVLGVETAVYRKRHELPASPEEMTMKLNATEYTLMREEMLSKRNFLRLSVFAMNWLRELCELYGGGLYASMSGVCACQVKDDVCTLYEVVSADPPATAASVAAALNCRTAVYYTPCPDAAEGTPFIMTTPDKVPLNTAWNIAYE